MNKPKINQRLEQTLTLSPQQLIKANILQLNSMMLEARLYKELESNPALEIIQPDSDIDDSDVKDKDEEEYIEEPEDLPADDKWEIIFICYNPITQNHRYALLRKGKIIEQPIDKSRYRIRK